MGLPIYIGCSRWQAAILEASLSDPTVPSHRHVQPYTTLSLADSCAVRVSWRPPSQCAGLLEETLSAPTFSDEGAPHSFTGTPRLVDPTFGGSHVWWIPRQHRRYVTASESAPQPWRSTRSM